MGVGQNGFHNFLQTQTREDRFLCVCIGVLLKASYFWRKEEKTTEITFKSFKYFEVRAFLKEGTGKSGPFRSSSVWKELKRRSCNINLSFDFLHEHFGCFMTFSRPVSRSDGVRNQFDEKLSNPREFFNTCWKAISHLYQYAISKRSEWWMGA